MEFMTNCIKGIAIGAGAIIPGLSSGVICVILGLYEKLLDKVINLFKDFKNNIKFLFPIGIGVICGVIVFGKILKYLYYAYPLQTNYTFIGLILGCIPALIKQTNAKHKFRLRYILYMIVALFIGIGMLILEKNIVTLQTDEFSFAYLVIAGMAMSIGVVVPGVSSTVILMLFGVYSAYLTSIANIYIPILLPIGIGLAIGAIICIIATKYLLENYYMQTFYSIIGFTIGSVFVLYPGFTFDLEGVISILCFILGFIIANIFEN